jgi:hypothetical protein
MDGHEHKVTILKKYQSVLPGALREYDLWKNAICRMHKSMQSIPSNLYSATTKSDDLAYKTLTGANLLR